ncbi:hypothetical protein HETIRDRAFT_480022 [Heterobasidion irregulare TC 32-1]|uniref:Uncharacterized protein n=1 Tax=Heterobasidion irregulare (strain TC 32-1) TaxID=747525 RepID=W4JWZ9_HETIT|nr:uncharacterized protein HETIRDRAFT_480022 [Heterobasidion irregulare TC 32-1]ETW77396.1 hypothetical protein HETIRDRAFT_480022 [Heterobasidion irregulare TC 32-1]
MDGARFKEQREGTKEASTSTAPRGHARGRDMKGSESENGTDRATSKQTEAGSTELASPRHASRATPAPAPRSPTRPRPDPSNPPHPRFRPAHTHSASPPLRDHGHVSGRGTGSTRL